MAMNLGKSASSGLPWCLCGENCRLRRPFLQRRLILLQCLTVSVSLELTIGIPSRGIFVHDGRLRLHVYRRPNCTTRGVPWMLKGALRWVSKSTCQSLGSKTFQHLRIPHWQGSR